MGAWSLRDPEQPFRPGCSYETLVKLIERGRITPETVLRGPTTRQFWAFASDTPGVAHLLGQCHNCHARARADDYMCAACGAVFVASTSRQDLGLAPKRLLPGQAPPDVVAASSFTALGGGRPDAGFTPAGAPLTSPEIVKSASLPAMAVMTDAAPSQLAPHRSPTVPETPCRACEHLALSRRLQRQLSHLKVVAALLAAACFVLAALLIVLEASPSPAPSLAMEGSAAAALPVDAAGAGPAADAVGSVDHAASDAATATGKPLSQRIAVDESRQRNELAEALELASDGGVESIEKAIRHIEKLRAEASSRAFAATLDTELRRLRDVLEQRMLDKFR